MIDNKLQEFSLMQEGFTLGRSIHEMTRDEVDEYTGVVAAIQERRQSAQKEAAWMSQYMTTGGV